MKWLQPGLVTFGAFWGLNPPFEWLTAGEPYPPGRGARPRPLPGPGHPERLIPHLPLSPAEMALWSQLASGAPGIPEPGRADRLP
ncbi:DUF6059 family protein [Kitasatospora sp. NPDC058170]|uniref:DUF6059 family protein n=1 Tax=Kitasatospora sp. NPDC058170 TaxID=3346364 RepID=UPI0036D7811A